MEGSLVLDKPYHNLKGIIVSKGMKQNDIADKLGMDKSTLSMKINRYKGRDFTFSEASKLADLLGVKMEDFQQYFFTLKVAKTTTKKRGKAMKETINEFLKFRSQFTKREWLEINQAVEARLNKKADQLKLDDSDLEIISKRLEKSYLETI